MRDWRAKNAARLKEYAREYRAANREEIAEKHRAYKREWCAVNRERVRARKRAWYQKHKGRLLVERAAFAEKFPEVVARWMANHRERYREANRAKAREWYAKHPERWREYAHKRRARRLASTKHFTTADVKAQRARQRGKCFYCKVSLRHGFHVDHVIPLSREGDNSPGNIVLACPTCNRKKGNKMPAEFAWRLL